MYRSFINDIVVINRNVMKSKKIIIITASLQGKVLNHLHMNHVGIKKSRMLTCKSIYWINLNANLEDTVKISIHILTPRQHSRGTKQYHIKY